MATRVLRPFRERLEPVEQRMGVLETERKIATTHEPMCIPRVSMSATMASTKIAAARIRRVTRSTATATASPQPRETAMTLLPRSPPTKTRSTTTASTTTATPRPKTPIKTAMDFQLL